MEEAMKPEKLSLFVLFVVILVMASAAIAEAQQPPDPRVADLVRAGRVRVGLALLPTFATKDPVTGELRGVAIDLARALAARLGGEVLPVEYSGVATVLDAGQRTDSLTTEERDEVRRLRREVRQLREERAILSKAAAWFARETNAIPSKDSSS